MDMKIIKFSNYMKESLDQNDGILIICDVQREFEQWIPRNFIHNLSNYCDDFNEVYQIWDANKAQNYSYKFPKTVSVIKKNYGVNFDKNIKAITERLNKKYPDAKQGDKFKLKDRNAYLVRIVNNHNWFLVNEDLYNLYMKLKGKRVIICGGSYDECLKDLEVSMESFGIKCNYNHNYIYSAETNDNQVAKIRN